MSEPFRGGPLEDGRLSQVHSLIVHMRGDGRYSVGAYVQAYDGEIPLGVFEWLPETAHETAHED
jgi:hypothetical protein